jgi:hypothetical protein
MTTLHLADVYSLYCYRAVAIANTMTKLISLCVSDKQGTVLFFLCWCSVRTQVNMMFVMLL